MPLGGGSNLSKPFIFFFGYRSVSSYYLWVGVLVTAKTLLTYRAVFTNIKL